MNKKSNLKALTKEQLRWTCNPQVLPFETTAEVTPTLGIVGQETARDALEFGVLCHAPGQNIYVRGPRGTGRIRMVRQLLAELAPKSESKKDYCYVHNFSRPDHPRLITLKPGTAHDFRRKIAELAEFVQSGLHKALEGEPYLSKRNVLQEQAQTTIQGITGPLEKELAAAGMALVSMPSGPMAQTAAIFPIVDGQPAPPEQLHALVQQGKAPKEQLEAFEKAFPGFQKMLQETGKQVAEKFKESRAAIQSIQETGARALLDGLTAPILKKFEHPRVKEFVSEIVENTIEYHLMPNEEESLDLKEIYGVNVVLTHDDPNACPVVEEHTPSMINLLGMVEPKWGPGGMAVSDFRGIRSGAILNADNGYLILDVKDLISEPGAWRALMRTLRTGTLEIVPPEAGWMRQQVVTQPEPIPINVRIILIGDVKTYYMLDHSDPDFRELFKVLADFDNEIPRSDDGVKHYASVVCRLIHNEGLPHFHRSAVAVLAEHGARIAARAGKLTARFGRVSDLAREAAFLAGDEVVRDAHVTDAIHRTKARASLPSRKFQELVQQETLIVETAGSVVGQINGMAVMHSGQLTYGFPARITASIGPGRAGLINIEGRAQMSGSIHTKGFHIIGGLLRYLLDTSHPLAFSASLAFEQSYGGIDGDSASGAEIICLLSALTGVPVKQSMAITGAIDQHGRLEAIGGVNEKIEGFFDACDFFGLTGDQGVVIPKSNAGELMLRQDVVDACTNGKFSVYAVDTIYDAMELMTGVVAGQQNEEGNYPEGSILAQAVEKAHEFWHRTMAAPAQLSRVVRDNEAPEETPISPRPDERP